MEIQGVKLEYDIAATGVGSCLSAKVHGGLNTYQMKMLENNEIPGLLPVHCTFLNGEYRVDYDITEMRRFRPELKRKLRGESAKKVIAGLLHTLSSLEEYFLSYTKILLDLDYIYLGEHGATKLVYLPVQDVTLTTEDSARVFFQKLFAEYLTSDRNPFFVEQLRYVYMQDFTLAGLIRRFEDGDGGEDAVQRSEVEEREPLPQEPSQPVAKDTDNDGDVPKPSGGGQGKKPSSSVMDGIPVPHRNNGLSEGNGEEKGSNKTSDSKSSGKADKKDKADKKEDSKKCALFHSLLGKSSKQKDEKKSYGENVSNASDNLLSMSGQAPAGAGNRDSGQGSGSANVPDTEANVWSGTTIRDGKTDTKTTFLGEAVSPYLLYRNQKIELDHFPFTIGRLEADFILGGENISRLHASLESEGGSYYVQDENSLNHTYLNGKVLRPFTRQQLQDGDELRIVKEIITFRLY